MRTVGSESGLKEQQKKNDWVEQVRKYPCRNNLVFVASNNFEGLRELGLDGIIMLTVRGPSSSRTFDQSCMADSRDWCWFDLGFKAFQCMLRWLRSQWRHRRLRRPALISSRRYTSSFCFRMHRTTVLISRAGHYRDLYHKFFWTHSSASCLCLCSSLGSRRLHHHLSLL